MVFYSTEGRVRKAKAKLSYLKKRQEQGFAVYCYDMGEAKKELLRAEKIAHNELMRERESQNLS